MVIMLSKLMFYGTLIPIPYGKDLLQYSYSDSENSDSSETSLMER